jgi:hypothetical protein
MSTSTLQILIGTALTDTTFRHGLLNGSRRRLLQTFPFSSDEIETIMGIQADSLEQFAGELHQRFLAKQEDVTSNPKYKKYTPRVYRMNHGILE